MLNPFDRFYDTELSVYEKRGDSYIEKGEKIPLGNVICDIQPYTVDTESKMFGLDSTRYYKLYCDKNDLIKNGRYVSFGGTWYMIVKTEVWSMGMTAMMRSVENEC